MRHMADKNRDIETNVLFLDVAAVQALKTMESDDNDDFLKELDPKAQDYVLLPFNDS